MQAAASPTPPEPAGSGRRPPRSRRPPPAYSWVPPGVAEPERDEPVRSGRGRRQGARPERPRQGDERRQNRNEQNHDRDERGGAGRRATVGRRQHRRARDETPEKVAAAVAHEHGGRVHVEAEKRQRAPGQRGRGERERVEAHGPAHDEERRKEARGDDRNAARQSVDVVEQIEGVRDPHDPGKRQEEVDRLQTRHRNRADHVDERTGDQELADELGGRAGWPEVVQQADREHRRAEHQQGPQRFPCPGGQNRDRGHHGGQTGQELDTAGLGTAPLLVPMIGGGRAWKQPPRPTAGEGPGDPASRLANMLRGRSYDTVKSAYSDSRRNRRRRQEWFPAYPGCVLLITDVRARPHCRPIGTEALVCSCLTALRRGVARLRGRARR